MKADEKLMARLTERQKKDKAALKAVREKQKVAAARDFERHALIVGRALLAEAAKLPDFDHMLRGVLRTAIAPGTSDYRFLQSKGYIP
jgi:hypothetical protein